jgi:23S rRNA (uracil1939-C5)-methyltransferase
MSRPRPGETLELAVRDLAFGGRGVASHEGLVVLVRGGLPGDHLLARVTRRRPRYLEADAQELLEPSPQRREPPCRHAAVCGGCPLMALPEPEQTRHKHRQALELLRRIGGIEPREVDPPEPAPRPLWYRNKMEFTFGRPADAPPGELHRVALGLHPPGRFDRVFDVTDCRLQSPLTNRILAVLRELAKRLGLPRYDSRRDSGLLRHVVVRSARYWPDLLVVLVVREWEERLRDVARELRAQVPQVTGVTLLVNRRRATVAQGEEEIPLVGRPFLLETLGGWTWRIGASTFFQTSPEGAERLIQRVLAWGQPTPEQTVVDLYCGVGTFTLPLARRAARVVGIESAPESVAEAREAARRHGVGNVAIVEAAVEDVLRPGAGPGETPRERLGLDRAPDLVVLDPPRAGLHPKALRGLVALAPRRILYVSCNPSTQARDAGRLQEAGYRALRYQVLDLFPQTPHMEAILLMERA